MKTLYLIMVIALLAGCAAQDQKSTQDIDQSLRDFIEVRALEPVNEIRTHSNDSWQKITERFVVYEARREIYLFEFVRNCHELNELNRVTPDVRWDNRTLRARFDTLRGCRIEAIYGLTEAEAAEVENIGEPPGSRN